MAKINTTYLMLGALGVGFYAVYKGAKSINEAWSVVDNEFSAAADWAVSSLPYSARKFLISAQSRIIVEKCRDNGQRCSELVLFTDDQNRSQWVTAKQFIDLENAGL